VLDLIWVRREQKYFCKQDWTGGIDLIPKENFSSIAVPGLRVLDVTASDHPQQSFDDSKPRLPPGARCTRSLACENEKHTSEVTTERWRLCCSSASI
jgi:hypothetical protein